MPAWLAVTLQVPTASSVSVLPLTVQTAGVVEANATASPELDVATSAAGALPRVRLPGDTKVIVCAAAATANEFKTAWAAANVASPAWLAATVHVPAPTKVRAVPLTVQTAGVTEVSDNARPDVEVATSEGAGEPRVWLPIGVNEMVCGSSTAATRNECETGAAAVWLTSPAWLAATLHVPGATSASALALTVHTLGVVEAKDTARPDVAVAVSAAGATPKVWLPGEMKVMVCAAGLTANEPETVGAVAYALSPAWLALTVQVPAPTSVTRLPLIVQTAGVVDANDTARPEVAVAVSAGGAAPNGWSPGKLKEMACGTEFACGSASPPPQALKAINSTEATAGNRSFLASCIMARFRKKGPTAGPAISGRRDARQGRLVSAAVSRGPADGDARWCPPRRGRPAASRRSQVPARQRLHRERGRRSRPFPPGCPRRSGRCLG